MNQAVHQSLSPLWRARENEDLLQMSQECRKIIRQRPKLGAGWAEVALLAREASDYIAARKAAMLLVDACPQAKQSWVWLATCEHDLGNYDEALKLIKAHLMQDQTDPELFRRAGRLLLDMGDRDGAASQFLAALSLVEDDFLAWEGYTQSHTFEAGDINFPILEEWRLKMDQNADPETRGILSYSIANVYEQLGEYEIAASRFWEAAAFTREAKPFDSRLHEQHISSLLNAYSPDFSAQVGEAGLVDSRPVFIMASPATGASWLSRVIAADEGFGILPRNNALFWMSSSPLGDQTPEKIKSLSDDKSENNLLTQIAQTYLTYTSELFPDGKHWVDPSGLIEMAGGLSGLALPGARYIVIRRDIRDLTWAIFKRRFRQGRHWTYHLDDIATVLKLQQALLDRWMEMFPDRIIQTSYEDLAADPAAEVRRLASFIGADPESCAKMAEQTSDIFDKDPVGSHQRAGSKLGAVEAALSRAGLI